MRIRIGVVLLAAVAAAVVAGFSSQTRAQTGESPAADRWTGAWEGKRDGLPSVILKVKQGGSLVQGQVSFNLIKAVDGGSPKIAGTMTVDMVNPHLRGNDLEFQVVREDRGGDESKREVLNFTLVSTGKGSAKLERAAGQEEGLEVEVSRVEE
jgi:hypothetical protein